MSSKQMVSKSMNIILWIAQAILSLTFIWAGSMKLFQSPGELAEMWPWTAGNTELVLFTGIVDMLAGIGLILPSLFRIRPWITVFTAYGAIALMVAASVFHISRGEGSQIGINIFIAVMAVFIVWGRTKKVPL